ncbi:MAG: hypothetical protein QOI71_2058 [Gaiellales bacterium]|nr:hypothetical protein [Gaiellales bacterium]
MVLGCARRLALRRPAERSGASARGPHRGGRARSAPRPPRLRRRRLADARCAVAPGHARCGRRARDRTFAAGCRESCEVGTATWRDRHHRRRRPHARRDGVLGGRRAAPVPDLERSGDDGVRPPGCDRRELRERGTRRLLHRRRRPRHVRGRARDACAHRARRPRRRLQRRVPLADPHQADRPADRSAVTHAPVDYAACARAFGVAGVLVEDATELRAALAQRAPCLIDARVDASGYGAILESIRGPLAGARGD